ncbi:MAG TPA: type III-B CRISPR module RAMP protein Cmr6 [Gemmataceae bacterium]|nr:type III-B CRISPR module RAMP protein Cmr6 [Gemmataceae bacterium]
MARGKIKKWLADHNIGSIVDDADGAEVSFEERALCGLQISEIGIGLEVWFDRRMRRRELIADKVWRAEVPVPSSLRELLRRVPLAERHPGLQLDRFHAPCPQQEQQRDILAEIASIGPNQPLLDELRQRWRTGLDHLHAVFEDCTTSAPLTLHLARASSLENAGLCLHPIYGFTYLPGTGLKGMAHAYACEVWLPTQRDHNAAWDAICKVFGRAPSPWLRGLARRLDVTAPADARAGDIVFHDAWPVRWPKLFIDIVNNHHPLYYREEDAPGDWESPGPVYFLAVEPKTTFQFALSKRRPDVDSHQLKQAREWLDAALAHLGCGAKTAAGYGGFRAPSETPPACPNRPTCAVTLELVTPAFLAGASQGEADCDLRPATLRGLLRWWWRTFHAGFVTLPALRRMETSVWGSTDLGGAVRLTVEPVGKIVVQRCPFKRLTRNQKGQDVLRFDPRFADAHGIELAAQNRTQGLVYGSYGMDEMDAGDLKSRGQRWYAAPGSQWSVRLIARDSAYVEHNERGEVVRCQPLSRDLILDQARLALWWFCRLGGVGSKARKGFGSFADIDFPDFEGGRWLTHGKAFRKACGLPEEDFDSARVASLSLRMMRDLAKAMSLGNWLEVETPWDDPWRALDEVGAAMQAFAQAPTSTGHGKHCPAKGHLGLPRKIHKGAATRELQGVHGDRHSSPVWYHITSAGRTLTVRVAAFPTAETREAGVDASTGFQQNRSILEQLLLHLREHLRARSGI